MTVRGRATDLKCVVTGWVPAWAPQLAAAPESALSKRAAGCSASPNYARCVDYPGATEFSARHPASCE